MATVYTRAAKGSALTWTEGDANITNLNNDKIEAVVDDTTPQLGGDLDVLTRKITTSTVDGDILVEANGTGIIQLKNDTVIGDGVNTAYLTSFGAKDLTLVTNEGTNSGSITIKQGANGNIELTPNGTGKVVITEIIAPIGLGGDVTLSPDGTGNVNLNADTVRIGDNNAAATLTTHGTGDLTLSTDGGTSSGTIAITAGANGNITVTPNGTGSIVLDGVNWPQADGTNGQVLKTNGAGQLSWGTDNTGVTVTNDTTTNATRYIAFEDVTSGSSTGVGVSSTKLTFNPSTGTLSSDKFIIGNGILSTENATHSVLFREVSSGKLSSSAFLTFNATSGLLGVGAFRVGISNSNASITTNGTGNLTLDTNSGSNSGNITIIQGVNGNISITPNGTGQTVIKNIEYNENIFSLGTTSGTIAPDVTNGNVQTITLNGNLTLNAFTNPVAGQSLTLIVNTGGTNRTLTSTMKFAGGSKTLSTTNTTDIISVFYDGTTYWASLSKDFV